MRCTRPRIDSIVVAVPACNEEALIDDCLDALDEAVRHLHESRPTITVETLVVLDACDDQTAARVLAHPNVGAISCHLRCVGAARAMAIAHVLDRGPRPDRVWVANADADSRVPSDWLAAMLGFADDHVDLVLGTVLPHDLPTSVLGRWLQRHRLIEGHPHIHGANMGLRADTYLAIGGFAPLSVGEDAALVQRAVEAGASIVRTATLPVLTSARLQGRATGGFATYLHAVTNEGAAG
jgi:cellulose synthase/poly-beta-1,6-N-acetylglucosamine synthase-like glycosyltransferase